MGGLRKKMPVTFWTFMVGTLALAACRAVQRVLQQGRNPGAGAGPAVIPLFFGLGLLVAVLTTFYMFRLVFVVFYGSTRSETAAHAHESPGVMIWPLRILAGFSLVGGFIGIESVYTRQFTSEAAGPSPRFRATAPRPVPACAGRGGVRPDRFGSRVRAAYALYAKASKDPLPEKLGALSRAMRNRFYFDELYEATVIRLHDGLATVADWIDRWLIAGLAVRGVHGTTEFVGRALRLLQTGNLQTYAFLFVLGVAVVLYFVLGK